jgi:hypothetical protein
MSHNFDCVRREGLQIMEDAIRHVGKHGHTDCDATAHPRSAGGFKIILATSVS